MSGVILPCPFCGMQPVVAPLPIDAPDETEYMVSCENNICPAGPDVLGETAEDAIECWNIRSGTMGSKPIAYLRGDHDGTIMWGEDCVCQDPVYPVNSEDVDGDGQPTRSIPVYAHPREPAHIDPVGGCDCAACAELRAGSTERSDPSGYYRNKLRALHDKVNDKDPSSPFPKLKGPRLLLESAEKWTYPPWDTSAGARA